MIVCVCHAVSDREIRSWSEFSDGDFEALQRDLGVSTRCGDCRQCAQAVLDECRGRGRICPGPGGLTTPLASPLTFIPPSVDRSAA